MTKTMQRIIQLPCIAIICGLTLSINAGAQQLERPEAIAAYIYNFAKNVQWQNEDAIKEFHFLMLGEDENIMREMRAMSKTKKLRKKPIRVSSSGSLEDCDTAQLVFVIRGREQNYVSLFDRIEGKNILLVSDGYPDKRLIMINFIQSEKGTLRFEINKANIINQHLLIMQDMILLGGTEVDVAALYREGQQSLRKLQKHAGEVEGTLKSLEGAVAAKTEEIQGQKDSLARQTLKIQEQQKILDAQSQKSKEQTLKIQEQQKSLDAQLLEFKERQKDLDKQIQKTQEQKLLYEAKSQELKKQQDEIRSGDEILRDQQERINRQQDRIASQSKSLGELMATIHRQQSIQYLLLTIIVLVAVLVLTVYRGYKSKQRINQELELKVAERTNELRESEQKYRELVENAHSIILRWTHEGRITFLNEFGLRFFDYPAGEIIGRHVMGTIVPETESDGRSLHTLMDEICANPAAFEQNVNENMRRNGERVWVAWTNKIIRDANGRVVEIFSVGTDITERKRAEEAIRELNAGLEQRVAERTVELAAAKDRAESADRVKSAFLATMSHELRTPLNSIIGFTGLLLQGLAGPLNAEQTKQLSMVKNSGQHLLALINDVLDISKIEAGQIEIANASFSLPDSIQKVVQTVTPLADKKRLPVIMQIAPEVSSITSDQRRLEQILINLLNNAIKFTEQGEVRVQASVGNGQVVIRVTDTGIGIKPEDLSKLFQPFRQLDTGLTRQHEGTGLGLAICRKLIGRLGGAIKVESEAGKGSTFEFTLPVNPERKS